MEKINLKNYKLPEPTKSKLDSWQEYALQVIKDFGIVNTLEVVIDRNGKEDLRTKNYRAIIFRHAKNNLSYLKGKVENAKEKFGSEGIKDKGKYLIALFKNK